MEISFLIFGYLATLTFSSHSIYYFLNTYVNNKYFVITDSVPIEGFLLQED